MGTRVFLLLQMGPIGLMDKASPSGGEDCGFESRVGHYINFLHSLQINELDVLACPRPLHAHILFGKGFHHKLPGYVCFRERLRRVFQICFFFYFLLPNLPVKIGFFAPYLARGT